MMRGSLMEHLTIMLAESLTAATDEELDEVHARAVNDRRAMPSLDGSLVVEWINTTIEMCEHEYVRRVQAHRASRPNPATTRSV